MSDDLGLFRVSAQVVVLQRDFHGGFYAFGAAAGEVYAREFRR